MCAAVGKREDERQYPWVFWVYQVGSVLWVVRIYLLKTRAYVEKEIVGQNNTNVLPSWVLVMDGTAKKRQKGSQARTYKKVDLTMSDSPSLTIYLEFEYNSFLFI